MKITDIENLKYDMEMNQKLVEISEIPGINELVRYFGYSLRIGKNSKKDDNEFDLFPSIKLNQLSYLLGKKSRVYGYLNFKNDKSLDSVLSKKQLWKLFKLFGFKITEKESFLKQYGKNKSYEKEYIFSNVDKGLIAYVNTKGSGQRIEFVRIHGQISEIDEDALKHLEGRKFRVYDSPKGVLNFRVDATEPIGWIKLLVVFDKARLNPTWHGKFEVGKSGLYLLNDYDANEILSQGGRYSREVSLDKIYKFHTLQNIVFG